MLIFSFVTTKKGDVEGTEIVFQIEHLTLTLKISKRRSAVPALRYEVLKPFTWKNTSVVLQDTVLTLTEHLIKIQVTLWNSSEMRSV